jgi:hypothetical protein
MIQTSKKCGMRNWSWSSAWRKLLAEVEFSMENSTIWGRSQVFYGGTRWRGSLTWWDELGV